jgi:hypothetical protein
VFCVVQNMFEELQIELSPSSLEGPVIAGTIPLSFSKVSCFMHADRLLANRGSVPSTFANEVEGAARAVGKLLILSENNKLSIGTAFVGAYITGDPECLGLGWSAKHNVEGPGLLSDINTFLIAFSEEFRLSTLQTLLGDGGTVKQFRFAPLYEATVRAKGQNEVAVDPITGCEHEVCAGTS